MTEGFVYILVNESYSGLVKVGRTSKDPVERALELSGATGVATPFVVFKFYQVSDTESAENLAHIALERVYGRPNTRREFFQCNGEMASALLDDALQRFIINGSLLEFTDAFRRLGEKSFTFSAIEFEHALKNTVRGAAANMIADRRLLDYFGAYLAACIGSNRSPIYAHFLDDPRLKANIVESLIKWRGQSSGSPDMDAVEFIRDIRGG